MGDLETAHGSPWINALSKEFADPALDVLYRDVLVHLGTRAHLPRVRLIILEDNEAVTKILKKKRSNAL